MEMARLPITAAGPQSGLSCVHDDQNFQGRGNWNVEDISDADAYI
jgi:hypothetical protein